MNKRWAAIAAVAAVWSLVAQAQTRPAPPATPRIYIFDNGAIKGLDPKLFNFERQELKEVDFIDVSYLIVEKNGSNFFPVGFSWGDPKYQESKKKLVAKLAPRLSLFWKVMQKINEEAKAGPPKPIPEPGK